MNLKEKEFDSLEFYTARIEDEVVRNRVNHMLIWFIKKATYHKYAYYGINILVIMINASIPIINQINFSNTRFTVSLIAGIASVLISILTIINIKDSWFRYRKHAELLKRECILYSCRWGDYAGENRQNIFALNVEHIIDYERTSWETSLFKTDEEK
nr:DUF4231 domain-containing protein [Neobacillus sp. Marseille-Q6967]